MSGIEVVGLVLGAFPLVISAMEYYEDVKKVGSTWWRIKRAHKKDLGRVKDCHLKFKLNLKELLLPLVLEGVVNKGEYESLLANPGGAGWKEDHVESALEERLAECHTRYVETLEDLVETLGRLSKACRVEDADFQDVLRRRGEKMAPPTPNQQAQTDLIIKANIVFEAKRVKYSFSGAKREDLLAEIETCNARLQDVLAANDRISALSQHNKAPAPRKMNSKSLNFGDMRQASFAYWTVSGTAIADTWEAKTPKAEFISGLSRFYVDLRDHVKNACSVRTPPLDLKAEGICKSCSGIHGTNQADMCLGTVSEGDHDYAIYPAVERVSLSDVSTLADLLHPQSALKLTRVQRYGIALTLASSHLQLHSTPWLKQYWTAQDVCFPTSASNSNAKALHGEPYILTHFDSSVANNNALKKDRSFSTLGIVLLELCFGKRLEDHHLWSSPAFAAGRADPMIRQTVACEWLEEVQGEAGEDYATAVNWTLRQAPIVVKDDRWRADFAGNVMQPLQRYYEYLNPKTSSP